MGAPGPEETFPASETAAVAQLLLIRELSDEERHAVGAGDDFGGAAATTFGLVDPSDPGRAPTAWATVVGRTAGQDCEITGLGEATGEEHHMLHLLVELLDML